MSKDFRINASAFENLKLRKLFKRSGDEGLLSLISLWAYTAEFKPSGLLGVCSAEDIEMMAAWEVASREGEFAKLVTDLRLIDHDDVAGYFIHDWPEHNPFAATGSGKVRSSVVDFRVDTGFMRHRKLATLRKQLGANGVMSLIRLWAYAAAYRTDGILDGMSYEDIAAESRWLGDDATYVSRLVDLRLLESEGWEDPNEPEMDPTLDGPFLIHGWTDWNAWRSGFKERSNRAKMAERRRFLDASPTIVPLPVLPTPIADAASQPSSPSGPRKAPPPLLVAQFADASSEAEAALRIAERIAERSRADSLGATILSAGTFSKRFS